MTKPARTQQPTTETSTLVNVAELDACVTWPQRTGTQTLIKATGTTTNITKQKKINCSVETVDTCAININFNAKMLVPGRPSVIRRTIQASLARFGEDHQTPLTRSVDRDEYRL